jgi:hypothetical protein
MHVSLGQLESGLKRIVRGWHPALVRSFERYASSKGRLSHRVKNEQAGEDPYWLLVPQWIVARSPGRRRTDQRFLLDVLCGQFCAFLALKIHDDLFDGHIRDRSLVFTSDYLLLSAREAFTPYFSAHSPFWPFFDSALKRTLHAIIETDHSQLHGYGTPSSVAALAREGYAACNIAAYAVCLRLNRVNLFQKLARCTDELAFVGQLLDDLEDMQEDFQRGRVNYAAWFLLGRSVNRRRNIMQQVARGIIVNGSAARFFTMLQKHLQRAGEMADSIGIPELEDYVGRYRKALEASETSLHRERVRMVFGIAAH